MANRAALAMYGPGDLNPFVAGSLPEPVTSRSGSGRAGAGTWVVGRCISPYRQRTRGEATWPISNTATRFRSAPDGAASASLAVTDELDTGEGEHLARGPDSPPVPPLEVGGEITCLLEYSRTGIIVRCDVSWRPTRDRCIGWGPPSAISWAFLRRPRRKWATLSVSRSSAVPRQRRSLGRGSVLECWRSSSRTTETPIERCTPFDSRRRCYVLHAFQKKSPSGIRTAKRDVDLVAERLKTAERDYEEHHGRQKR